MMMLIYMKDGQCIEVEAGSYASRVDGELICFDHRGAAVATFPALEVEAYTTNPDVAEAFLEEICEDLTVVPAGGAPESAEGCS